VSLVALVLAAGESTRMGGRPKPLLEHAGETFLERILRTLGQLEGLDARLVVLGHQATAVRHAIDWGEAHAITHRGYRQGMLSSLKAGARAALKELPDLEALMVVLVDQPLVQAETYAALLNAFQPDKDDVVIASYGGEHGHPVVLARPFVEHLLADGRAGSLGEFIERHAARRRYVDCDDPAVVQNVNTPEAYEALRQPEESS
jgi:CTP:molybdopterin cytidylyltransferase MocA